MGFEKGDIVRFHDKHSEYDGDVGEVSQVSETMFGDNTYIVQFEAGQEAGIPEDSLEEADEADAAPGDGSDEGAAEPADGSDAG